MLPCSLLEKYLPAAVVILQDADASGFHCPRVLDQGTSGVRLPLLILVKQWFFSEILLFPLI